MASRRFLYLAVLLGCCVFYIAYGEWLSFLVLLAVLGLPWFSLVLSLPAILGFRVSPSGPDRLETGEDGQLWLLGSCSWPMPMFRGRLYLQRCFTGERMQYRDSLLDLTKHCGGYTVTAEKVRICDYLGLFSFPVAKKDRMRLLVLPRPVETFAGSGLNRQSAVSWRPKPGGGFSENHELRLYRPGDKLNQVHWKLSAKTGRLILREPVEPQRRPILLTMNLRGTPEELDRMLGRFLWLGQELVEKKQSFQLRVLSGDGLFTYTIASKEQLIRVLDALLCLSAAREGDLQLQHHRGFRQYHIGGNADEA